MNKVSSDRLISAADNRSTRFAGKVFSSSNNSISTVHSPNRTLLGIISGIIIIGLIIIIG